MSANKGFDETLTVPQNHKDSGSANSKSMDTHFRTLNTGIISVAKNLGTMHNNVAELTASMKTMLVLRDRIDSMEKTLINHSRMLSDLVESAHRQESLIAKLAEQTSKQMQPVPCSVLTDVPVEVVAEIDNTKDTTVESVVMLSAPVVKELATVKVASVPSSVVNIASIANTDEDEPANDNDNDEVQISESDEEVEEVKPKPKPVPAKKKPVVKRAVSKR